jgi:hypothetical protein
VFSRNSNFLCEPESKVVLGVLEAPYDARWKSLREQVRQMALRLGRGAGRMLGPGGEETPSSPHQLRLYVGKQEVTGESPNDATSLRVLESACGDPPPGWTPKRAVRVEAVREGERNLLKVTKISGSRNGATHSVDFMVVGCKPSGDAWSCPVAGYGVASLVVPR